MICENYTPPILSIQSDEDDVVVGRGRIVTFMFENTFDGEVLFRTLCGSKVVLSDSNLEIFVAVREWGK